MKNIAVAGLLASLAVTASSQVINNPVIQGCENTDPNGECWDIQAEDSVCIRVPEIAASRIHSLRTGEGIYCDVFEDDECTNRAVSLNPTPVLDQAIGSVQCWSTTANLRRNDLARRAKSQRAKKNAEERENGIRRRSSAKKPFWFPPEIQTMIEKERDKIVAAEKAAERSKFDFYNKRSEDSVSQPRRRSSGKKPFWFPPEIQTMIEKERDKIVAAEKAAERSKFDFYNKRSEDSVSQPRRRSSGKKPFWFPPEIQAMIEKERDKIVAAEKAAERSKFDFYNKRSEDSVSQPRRRSSGKKPFWFPPEIQAMIEKERDKIVAAEKAAERSKFDFYNKRSEDGTTVSQPRRRSSAKKPFWFPPEIQAMIEKERDKIVAAEKAAERSKFDFYNKRSDDGDSVSQPRRRSSAKKPFWFPPEIQAMIEKERDKIIAAEKAAERSKFDFYYKREAEGSVAEQEDEDPAPQRMRRRSSAKKPFWFPPEIQAMIEKERDKIVAAEKAAERSKFDFYYA